MSDEYSHPAISGIFLRKGVLILFILNRQEYLQNGIQSLG